MLLHAMESADVDHPAPPLLLLKGTPERCFSWVRERFRRLTGTVLE
jgi:hypothetical protein